MSLTDWYADREVLLTGVTSEVGRSLLEKILRSFPNVKIYAVIRSRAGFNKDDRIKNILLSPRCERLRQEDPNAVSRVTAVEGNLLYEGLGMSKDDRASLSKVSLAFHAGGPHEEVFEFCRELPKLEALAAISSIFRHKGKITESLQNERVPDHLPLALVRIPFVGPAYREPMPGFVEILKGPTALMVGAGLALGRSELQAELIPIDLAVNTLIACAWERATKKDDREAVVYNAATVGCTWNDLIKKGGRGNRNFEYPTFGIRGMTSNQILHWILVVLLAWLPSFVCDTIIGLCGGKQRILQEHDRVRNALRSLESISSRPWSAKRDRVYLLQKRLTPEEQEAFPLAAEIDIEVYILCAAAAARKHCVNETNLRIVKLFRRVFYLLVAGFLFYVLFLKHRLPAEQRVEPARL